MRRDERNNRKERLKKAGIVYLLSQLLLAMTGISLHLHYSGDKLYDAALFGSAESCCETECECCSERFEYSQLSDPFLENSQQKNIDQYRGTPLFCKLSSQTLSGDLPIAGFCSSDRASPPMTQQVSSSFLQVFII